MHEEINDIWSPSYNQVYSALYNDIAMYDGHGWIIIYTWYVNGIHLKLYWTIQLHSMN